MSENWKGTEAQLFAEFVEHREMFMIMRKWWRPGYEIRFLHLEENEKQGPENFMVRIIKNKNSGGRAWEVSGVGVTLDEAAKQAAAGASFRD